MALKKKYFHSSGRFFVESYGVARIELITQPERIFILMLILAQFWRALTEDICFYQLIDWNLCTQENCSSFVALVIFYQIFFMAVFEQMLDTGALPEISGPHVKKSEWALGPQI